MNLGNLKLKLQEGPFADRFSRAELARQRRTFPQSAMVERRASCGEVKFTSPQFEYKNSGFWDQIF